jgi:DNA-binding MarR family transcriptional regulator
MKRDRFPVDIPNLVNAVHRHLYGELDRILKADRLPVEQWRILRVLADEQGRAMGELAALVHMNLPALSKTIDRMVTRALVHRKQHQTDHRRVLVYVTDFGLDLLAGSTPAMEAYQTQLTRRLGKRRTSELNRLLRSLVGDR